MTKASKGYLGIIAPVTVIHDARNALKQQARDMMAHRAAAEKLAKDQPLRPLQHYVEKYSTQGYQNQGLWQRIIQGGTIPNAAVNERFGVK